MFSKFTKLHFLKNVFRALLLHNLGVSQYHVAPSIYNVISAISIIAVDLMPIYFPLLKVLSLGNGFDTIPFDF